MSDATLDWMKHNGVPITRENYIALNWMEVPTDWDHEHESDLPEELQNWPAVLDMHEQSRPAHDEFNPSEARDPKGEWTAGGGAPSKAGAPVAPEAPKLPEAEEKKLVDAVGPKFKNIGHIPRADMPQVPSARAQEFQDWMQREGVKVTHERVPSSSLKMTQEAVDQKQVDEIAAALPLADHNPKYDKPVAISRDNYILDGHHTAMGHAKAGMDVAVTRYDTPIRDLLEKAETFTDGEGKRDMSNAPVASVEKIVASIPGAPEKCEEVEAKLAKGTPTDATPDRGGFKREDGTWTPERERMHQKILRSILTPEAIKKAIPAKGEKPLCVVLGGRGGSGKSWFSGPDGPLKDFVNHSIYINADDLQEKLPGYEGWNAALYHEEASHLADLLEQRCRRSGLNVIHDATMRTWISSAARIAAYQRLGYQVKSYFMDCKPETSVKRAVSRFMRSGRYVSPQYLMSSTSNLAAFKQLRDFCDDWQEYTSEGAKPELVDSKEKPTLELDA